MKEKHKIGFFGLSGTLTLYNGFIRYVHPFGRFFKVKLSDVDTVTVDTLRFGYSELKIVGKGTVLATIKKIPHPLAEKCQEWILSKM